MQAEPPRSGLVLLLAIVVLGAAARFYALDFGLPHTQARPDETFTIDVALSFMRGQFWPNFYDYPRLFMYLVTALYLARFAWGAATGQFHTLAEYVASWRSDWAPFFLMSRSLAAVAGIGTILVVYAIARRIAGRVTALVAALFMSLAYLHVRDSHFGTTDTTLVLLTMISVWWLLRARLDRRGFGREDVLAAVVAGLATATKYNAALLAVPLAVSQVLHAVAQPARRVRALFDSRAFVIGLGFGLALFIGVPFVLFDWTRFYRAAEDVVQLLKVGQTPQIGLPNGWWYHLIVSLRHGVGIPLLLSGLAGVVVVIRRDWRQALLLLSFPAVYYGVAGSMRQVFVRYVLLVVPFLCITAACFVTWLVARVAGLAARGRAPRAAGAAPAFTTILALLVIAPSAWNVVSLDRLLGQTDNRVLVARWMARHAALGASVAQSGTRYGYAQFGDRRDFQYWTWDKDRRAFVVQGTRAEGQPDWLLVQQSALPSETQQAATDLLQSGYQLMATFRAADLDRAGNVYDVQDAFFMPFAGFRGVERPGPNFLIYKNPHAPVVDAGDLR